MLSEGCKREEAGPPTASPQATTQCAAATDVISVNNRGVGLMGKFEYEQARQAFEEALALAPENPELRVNLAIATLNRQREGDEDRALALLDQTLTGDPSNVRANYCVGLLRLYLESPALAQPHFQKVVDADAGDAFAAYYLGQCLAQQKQYEGALKQYQRAIAIDPRIRSAYYAASQALRALGRDDDAGEMLGQFQELERNPRARLAEFKYTRMGPKAMAQPIDAPAAQRVAVAKPGGPLFLDPEPLLTNGDQFQWKAGVANPDVAISITAADLDHDGDIDIFIANCLDEEGLHNAVCINDGSGKFTLDRDHVLAAIPDVNAALWGDVDNDGFIDVYLCRRGPNMLWRQTAKNAWRDATTHVGVAGGEFDSIDGALFDADHDGDLDIFVVNADGPNELFNNNLDGTFKPIAAQAGISGEGKGSRQVLPVDLDGDRDLDIIVIHNQAPQDVWINERGWIYRRGDPVAYAWLTTTPITGIAAADGDADGDCEPYVLSEGLGIERLRRNDRGGWTNEGGGRTGPPSAQGRWFSLADIAGDGRLRGVLVAPGGWSIVDPSSGMAELAKAELRGLAGAAIVVLDTKGPSVVAIPDNAPPEIIRPGPGRFPFTTVSFTGKSVTSDNKQVRSNASGIGTRFAARIDSMWVAGDTLRNSSGPGQSLQPVAIGAGGHNQIDFIAIDWADGVFQTEVDLKTGTHHVIEETQRQLSSCPVLFTWDGTGYRFITDMLGVGGIGYLTAPGEYAPSRPWENLLLPREALAPREGEMIVKLGEPMEEACYLDAARLVAYDLPPGWDMTVDDRMNIAGPEPTGAAMFYRRDSLRAASRAVNDRGEDVTRSLREADLAAAPLGEIDARFIGRLKGEHVVTMSFDASAPPSESAAGRRRLTMLIDGWVEYPYSQTMFAAWQAQAAYRAPALEVRDGNGEWRVVYEQFGYPAGMPRQMAIGMPDTFKPSNAMEMRIRTNQEVYFDRIALVEIEDCPRAIRRKLALNAATLADVGFPRRTTGPQRQPSYDYDSRAPLWDTRHQRGWYTEFGAVNELVADEDDAMAIFGPGEEIELRFDAGSLPPLATGWTRRFVLEARGWCKDMDLYTRDGETLQPLPLRDGPRDSQRRDALHRQFNTRYEAGR